MVESDPIKMENIVPTRGHRLEHEIVLGRKVIIQGAHRHAQIVGYIPYCHRTQTLLLGNASANR
jgi:hypothetical protein